MIIIQCYYFTLSHEAMLNVSSNIMQRVCQKQRTDTLSYSGE